MKTIYRNLLVLFLMTATVTVAQAQKKLDKQVVSDLQKKPKY